MNISSDPLTNITPDNAWKVQGRIIPPSCSQGEGCILHLQTRQVDWAKEHFHIGRSGITTEAGLELAMAILVPFSEDLFCYSFDPDEQRHELDYLQMVKLEQPKDTIAFITTNGLTIVIQIEGLGVMFSHSPERCKDCAARGGSTNIPTLGLDPEQPFNLLDPLMLMKDNGKSH